MKSSGSAPRNIRSAAGSRGRLKTLALALVALALGCGRAVAPGYFGRDYTPTALTAARHQYHGFSVAPPRGPNWRVRVSEQSSDAAIYRQELASETHTFVASVKLIRLEENVPFEESGVPHGLSDPARYTVLENTHQPDGSRKTQCIRYSVRLLDKAAPNSPNAPLLFVDKGLVCAHPTIPGVAVRASFSERGLPQESDPRLWDALEAFLQGVQLESAPGVPAG